MREDNPVIPMIDPLYSKKLLDFFGSTIHDTSLVTFEPIPSLFDLSRNREKDIQPTQTYIRIIFKLFSEWSQQLFQL